MVPESWRLMKLDDISEKVMVGIASAATHAYSDSGIRMLRNLNIKEGWIDDSDILYVNSGYEKAFRNKRLKQGDILTVRTGYPGVSAVVPMEYEGAQCFTSLITRLDQRKAFPDFVCRYINSEYGKKFITSGESGGAQKNVNAGMLKRMVIPLPPLPEQKKIAQILSTWDNAISATERLLENSKQRKKALMQQLLTGKKRLPGFEGEWGSKTIKSLASLITKGTTPSTNGFEFTQAGIPFIKVESIRENGTIDFNKVAFIDEDCHAAFKRSQLKAGDILFTIAGALGRIAIVPNSIHEGNTNQAVAIIRLYSSAIDTSYCFFALNSELLQKEIIAETAQAAQPNLSLKNVGNFEIYVPKIHEQQAIAKVLTTADQEIDALQKRLDHLKLEKKALMQQLLTGKRRVQVDAAA